MAHVAGVHGAHRPVRAAQHEARRDIDDNFGRLMGIFLLIYGLMSPVAGVLADRLNRK